MPQVLRLAILTLAALAVACGGASSPSSGTPPAGAGTAAGATVTYRGFQVSPATVEVKPGQAVAWKNEDSQQHTVTAGRPGAKGAFDRKVDAAATTQIVFDAAGTFDYFCEFHPTMVGKVVVK